jgi:hypothetical protein
MLFAGAFPTVKDDKIIKTAWENSQPSVKAKCWCLTEITVGMIACAATVVSCHQPKVY